MAVSPHRYGPNMCELCGRALPTGRRKWCSKRCNDRARSVVPTRPFTCEACGATVLVPKRKLASRKYCSLSCSTKAQNAARIGAKNGRWRGGVALNYGAGWKATKERIRLRDGVCRHCGKTPASNGRALDVHHIEPFRFSRDHSDDNLVALCRSCHMRAPDHGRRGSSVFVRAANPAPTRREMRRAEQAARATERQIQRVSKAARARELRAAGWSLRAIASATGVSHQTVGNWLSET